MRRLICTILILSFSSFNFIGCAALFNSGRERISFNSYPSDAEVLVDGQFFVKSPAFSPTNMPQAGEGWTQLMHIGPGRDAIVTFTDGTLRGGRIIEVNSNELHLQVAGQTVKFARSAIAVVKVMRQSHTFAGGLIGFLLSGVALTAMVCGGDDCATEGIILVFAIAGVPGGVLGALIGSQVGGDVEIVP